MEQFPQQQPPKMLAFYAKAFYRFHFIWGFFPLSVFLFSSFSSSLSLSPPHSLFHPCNPFYSLFSLKQQQRGERMMNASKRDLIFSRSMRLEVFKGALCFFIVSVNQSVIFVRFFLSPRLLLLFVTRAQP